MTTGKNGSQEIETRIGTLEFTHDFANGFPTDATIEKLYDERDFQRACQAYLWSLPAVSFAAWQRGVSKGLGVPGTASRPSPTSIGPGRCRTSSRYRDRRKCPKHRLGAAAPRSL